MARASNRDGLNSSIRPQQRGASAGLDLPPRTHAIHVALYRASRAMSLFEIESQLAAWGYHGKTLDVTKNHLRSLCVGWGKDEVKAAEADQDGRYKLTAEGRFRLSGGMFSDRLA